MSTSNSNVVRFGKDTTVRWKCEPGDFVMWIPGPDLFSGDNQFKIADIWEARAGDSITITNKPDDFPAWFKLAPSEVSGRAAYELTAKLKAGAIKATDPIEAANVWKVPAGARVAWLGAKRAGYDTFPGTHGVLQLLDFEENALVAGESPELAWETFALFGALTKKSPSREDREMIGAARTLVAKLGISHVVSTEWTIG